MKHIIYKNCHFSLPLIPKIHCNVTACTYSNVKFDKNCWYSRDSVEYTGLNKLFGLGYGFNHHKNSIRIAWQPNFDDPMKQEIMLYAYWYDHSSKEYQSQYYISINTERQFDVLFNISDESYLIETQGVFCKIPKLHDKRFGFHLNPWFGGHSKAPATMKIEYKFKKIKL